MDLTELVRLRARGVYEDHVSRLQVFQLGDRGVVYGDAADDVGHIAARDVHYLTAWVGDELCEAVASAPSYG